MADRWIYGFRRTGSRELSDEERREFKRLAAICASKRLMLSIAAVALGVCGVIGIVIGAGAGWGWLVVGAGLIGFIWTLHLAGKAERMRLLFRRASRKGLVDEYVRDQRTAEVWASHRKANADEEEPPSQPFVYWEADEKFEERLEKMVGQQPSVIETPTDDDVVITVERKVVTQVVDVSFLDV
jgi:hypothetical protein